MPVIPPDDDAQDHDGPGRHVHVPDVPSPEKALYSLAEVAAICGRPPGLVRRWVYRRQLAVIWLDDEPLVPLVALRHRLRHPVRIERSLRGRRRLLAQDLEGTPAGDPTA